eukprot:12256218-Heterocapsa_arctica.AAC.1
MPLPFRFRPLGPGSGVARRERGWPAHGKAGMQARCEARCGGGGVAPGSPQSKAVRGRGHLASHPAA